MKSLVTAAALLGSFLLITEEASAIKGIKRIRPPIRIECRGLKCRGTVHTPPQVRATVRHIDKMIRRNSATLSFAGRAFACAHTMCATEVYIEQKKREALAEADRNLREFYEQIRSDAEMAQKAETLQTLNSELRLIEKRIEARNSLNDHLKESNIVLDELADMMLRDLEEIARHGSNDSEAPEPAPEVAQLEKELLGLSSSPTAQQVAQFDANVKAKAAELNISIDDVYTLLVRHISPETKLKLAEQLKNQTHERRMQIVEQLANGMDDSTRQAVLKAKINELEKNN